MTAFSQIAARAPSRVIDLPPSAFADEWPDKPAEAVKVGLRLLSEGDLHAARAQAADRAVQLHEDAEGRVEAYNDTLMAWAVANALCEVDDARIPYLESAFENVFLAFTSEGIRRIWEEIEVMHIERSPIIDEIDSDGVAELVAKLQSVDFGSLGPREARVRRLLSFVLDEMRA